MASKYHSVVLVDRQFVVSPLTETMEQLGGFHLISPLVHSRPVPVSGTGTIQYIDQFTLVDILVIYLYLTKKYKYNTVQLAKIYGFIHTVHYKHY